MQVALFSTDADVGLIHSPRFTDASTESVPSQDGRLSDVNAALGHHFNKIPLAQHLTDVPADAQRNDFSVEQTFSTDRVTDNRPSHSFDPR